MNKYVIVTDSCSDLSAATREKFGIEYIAMRLLYDGNDIPADLDWKDISAKDFYRMMREGVRFRTSQINAADYVAAFENYIKQGYDILSISCSSALSSSYNGSVVARKQLLERYPDSKIYCIDSLNACLGLGMLCMTASEMRADGKTIDEVAAWLEEHKKEVNQFCTVENLTYFKRAGRVSAASAFFGGLLQVKPIVISDAVGMNFAVEKVKGRNNSLVRCADLFLEAYESVPYQRICICHADCEQEAEQLKRLVMQRMPDKDVEIYTDTLGPIIGATAGPGTVAVLCYGKTVTVNAPQV